VAGESFHPHGGQYQVDLERRRRDWCGFVAPECVWAISFPLAHPCWVTTIICTIADILAIGLPSACT